MPSRFLRLPLLLGIDAAACAGMGVLLLAASLPLAAMTRLPPGLLFWAGALLLPVAALMIVVSRSLPASRWAVNLVILGNLAWALASIALPLTGLVEPNGLGWCLLVGQAVVVALLAKLEHDAARIASRS